MNELDAAQSPPPVRPLEYAPPPPTQPRRAPDWILLLLSAVSTTVALTLTALGKASVLEAVSFITGAICVWLTVRESVWNFPIGLLNVATFAVVFFRARLFADASLQLVYVVLTLIGWYWWLYGGQRQTALRVSRVGRIEALLTGLACIVMTFVFWRLVSFAGGISPFWDALTTALSLCAQWLLNRKRLENWFFWIAADLIYIPLYAFKGLYLSSILYMTFLAMCIIGIRQWRDSWRARHLLPEAA